MIFLENFKLIESFLNTLISKSFILSGRKLAEDPAPQEIFIPIPINENRFALKTGFGKYMGVNPQGLLTATADAYGPHETFEPVFQDGKCALQAVGNDCFLSINDQDQLVAIDRQATEEHMVRIRCSRNRKAEIKEEQLKQLAKEEHGSLFDAERNYARKFQSRIGGGLILNSRSQSELKKARQEGLLHSTLLQRRSEMKADKYCK